MPAPSPVESIFDAARSQRSPAERAAYLDGACGGDADLRRRVEELLAAHEQIGSFLEHPADREGIGAEAPEPDESIVGGFPEKPGDRIGPYKLMQLLGEGGMGSVWVAEQEQPVQRRVALKLIKAGMDSAQVLRRFEAERQALALMDHANIAKVFDAGATPQGRPFFAMELIRGIPITKFCDQEHLSPRERLELFVPVCQAVQHAHQKGVIHRDLKPSNVLIALYDGKPVPKVIDFGVAKATSQKLSEGTIFTEVGQIVGTLEYMAPEQAELNNLDIDTRADIYSLGVILYELLTGSAPFTAQQLRGAAFTEMLRMIREVEPPKPSTRLSSSAELPSIAANRKLEPKRLTRLVLGDLDWIVMKALEKDRGRRYGTANGFAADVLRYLSGEPVVAHPPSPAYRFKKFVRRNRGPVIAASLVLLALVLGIAGTTFGLFRAEDRRVEAEQAKQEALDEKAKAEQAEAETLASYRASTDDAIEQLIGSKPELGLREKTYLEKTLKRWQAFARRQGDDERSQAIRAEGHYRVAFLWQKLGRRDEARTEYETARELKRKLVAALPGVPQYQQELAQTHSSLGILLRDLGQRDAARSEHETARDLLKKLAAAFPDQPQYQRDLARTHHNLGTLLAGMGQRDAARMEYEAARDLLKKLSAAYPDVPQYQQSLATTRNNLGNLLRGLGQRDAARTEFEVARDLQQKLATAFPAVPDYKAELGRTHHNLGVVLSELGERDAARTEYESARDWQKRVAAAFPAMPQFELELARTHNSLGVLLVELGQRDAARTEYETARDVLKKLADNFPDVPLYQVELGGSYSNFGEMVRHEGQPADSLRWYDLAIRTLMPVYERDRRTVLARQFLRASHSNRARAHDQLTKYAEAVSDWDKAIEFSSERERPSYRASRANSRLHAGQVAEAVAEAEELTKASHWSDSQWFDFACIYAVASDKSGDKKQGYADRAMELLRQAVRAGYKDAAHMGKDNDLGALRERDDFKKLLADLEVKKK